MEIKMTHEGGWNNGAFMYNGLNQRDFIKIHAFSPEPEVGLRINVTLDGLSDTGTVKGLTVIHGSDSDHGKSYSWDFRDYSFLLDGDKITRAESIFHFLRHGATITWEVK